MSTETSVGRAFLDYRIEEPLGQGGMGVEGKSSRSMSRRRGLWWEIERDLVLQAPVVPIANVRQRVFVSRRVGNHQSHPLWGSLIEQLWVR